jgi:phage tail sheath gpL-like
MTVPFKHIPANIRVPLFYAEVDNSQANTATQNQRALIIGQITSAGAATAGVPVISQGIADARVQGGPDSMLALMTAAYRLNDNFGEVWYLPLADDPAATAATGSIQITHAATAGGTLPLYVGGNPYPIPITTTQATTDIATAIAAAINADIYCPVNASVVSSTVTFTAVNKGPCGNEIDLRLNYGGALAGEATPAGLTYTLTAMSGGATAPSLTTPFANLLDMPFDFIVFPYTDTTSLNAVKALLDDNTGRWAWSRQIYGHAFAAARGTLSTLTTLGTARNDQHTSIMGFYDSPTPAWIWAAALAAQAAVSVRADPGLPMQTLPLLGVKAPPLASRFALTDRNTLLYDGISTFNVGQDGTVAIENLITTYQTNSWGQPDNSYLEVETLFTLAYVLRAMAAMVTSKYARVKLAANGTRFGAGAAVVTPNTIRGDLIAKYRELETAGLVQNGDAFKAALIVEKDASNPNRVNVLWPGTLIDQLRIFALLAQFRL